MARLQRCDELITLFRMRLGEPKTGTFGVTYYDGLNENVHELRSILNQAQAHVTWICYSANQSLLENTIYLPVLSGVTRYTLPEDYLAPVWVKHHTQGQEYEVEKDNLSAIRSSTRTERFNYHFRNYEIRETVPLVAARGIVSADSVNQITDDRLTSAQVQKVRAGDTAYNLTDNSQGEVEAVFSALQRIQVGRLFNGETNRFQVGDIYEINMREATRDAIDFWPSVTKDDSQVSYTGPPGNWKLNQDNVLYRVLASFSEIPSNFEADERLTLQVLDGTTVLAIGARDGLVLNTNEFHFPTFTQLREDVFYSVKVLRGNGQAITPDFITVIVRLDPESVEFRYVKLPKPMETNQDYCEMPSWSIEAVFAYAHIIAQKKMSRNPNADRGLLAEFDDQIDID